MPDVVFWTTHSTRSHLAATVGMFAEYKELHFPLDRFEVVNNCYNLPGSIEVEEMNKFFQQLQKKILAFLPWEESIPLLANQLKFEVVDDPQSEWVKGLRVLLGRVLNIQPVERKWASAVSDEEFARTVGVMWAGKAGAPAAVAGGAAAPAAAQAGASHEKSEDNLPPFWESLKQRIHKDVVKAMEMERVHVSDEVAANQDVRKKVSGIADDVLQKQQGVQLTRDQRVRFINELLDEILGLGPIEELMRDATVTEIMVNAPDKVFIERRGKLVLTKYRFRDNDHVVQVMKRIVAPLGRRIDESVPYVDARLKDGSRVNAIIAPLAVSGPTLTIRRFSQKPLGPEDYYRFGSISRDAMD
ncbi:MAG TPA: ATPase, T2SS/T4P/T4SS family, partial [Elusimicrobiales bacterium]|nr:ATPase, T2SS/T4P/T4SS family [Elusimicrobiales bacterium]